MPKSNFTILEGDEHESTVFKQNRIIDPNNLNRPIPKTV